MKNILLPLIFTCSLLVSVEAQARFKKSNVVNVGRFLCGFDRTWVPIKRVGKRYVRLKKAKLAHRSACNGLLRPSSMSLSAIPDLASITAPSGSNTRSLHSLAGSATPPTLREIVSGDPSSIFWREGVISAIANGSPSEEQCNEFLNQSEDGRSGGFLACYMAQNVGQALTEVVRAGTTMCYLKQISKDEILNSGALTVTSGRLPDGSISTLFGTPAGARPRVVRIGLSSGGEYGGRSDGIIKIFAASQIAASGDRYRYEMIFCEADAEGPQEVELTRITTQGEFVSRSANVYGSGRFAGTVRAFLRSVGDALVFDTSRPRRASFSSVQEELERESQTKAEVVISTDNTISSKEYGLFGDETRKAFSVSSFSGSGIASIRFLEGAVKQTFSFGDLSGATEFRDSSYVTSSSTPFASELDEVDLETDPFYSGEPEPDELDASIGCDTEADVEIVVDMDTPEIEELARSCESERLDAVQFCQSDELTEAMEQYPFACFGED